ncbi:MAG TPA: biopolymer transporter ExbD [Patescibacteria group bacterium]|nr:biopolymer transporter ExbD [Patescibacteria group bacterium]
MLNKILGRQASVHIDMTPMVDVMMLLVIFFMMSTVFIVDDMGLAINLPEAAAAKPALAAVTVAVDKEGRMAVDGQVVTKPELVEKLSAMSVGKTAVVSIKADKEARHGQVVEAMDLIRKAGIVKISIAVEDGGPLK